MKFFVNKQHKIRFWFSLISASLLFMYFMPYGSFDPGNIGFWLSIVCALIIGVGSNLVLRKYQRPK